MFSRHTCGAGEQHTIYDIRNASVAELADAPGLGPGGQLARGGSNPLARS